MADVKQLLEEGLAQLETASKLRRDEVLSALAPAENAAKEAGEAVDELWFELTAAELVLYEDPNVWGTHYGPWFTRTTNAGDRVDTPPIESITSECIEYWTTRMRVAQHPVLRARYADLVWDLSKTVTGNGRPFDAARIAIHGYIEALVDGRCEPLDPSCDVQKRALNLALSIKDDERLQNATAKLMAYASAPLKDRERELRQRELFGLLMKFPRNRWPDAEIQTLANDLRNRLDELVAEEPDHFTIQNVAVPLADYYRSTQRLDEAKGVLRVYGAAVARMSMEVESFIVVGWLDQLYKLYRRFEMNEDAAGVLQQMEARQPDVSANLARVSVSLDIKDDELQEFLGSIITPDLEMSIARLIEAFLPRVDNARNEMRQLQKEHRLLSMIPSAIVDHEGRKVARVGAGESDDEGNLVWHIYQSLQFADFFLAHGLERLFTTHELTVETLFAQITQSPVWDEKRHPVLRRGLEAYFSEDPIVAVHLFVTEIENAVRIIAAGRGVTTQKPNGLGGFDLKNLSNFLADEHVKAFLTDDVTTYLRIVLTDRRGWNLRNDTCHGIVPATSFTQAAARRLLHVVLLLSAIRPVAASTEWATDDQS